ncbi:MAG: T9SS type A sorting domain-containing protein [Saprospiraceae bacterium]
MAFNPVCNLHAQEGYINHYDFDKPGAIVSDMLLDEDTLVLTGLIFPDSLPFLQGFFFAKLDTLGNVIQVNSYFDSLERHYVVGTFPSGMIKLQDQSGYLVLGGIFQSSSGMAMKISPSGERIWVKEFIDENTQNDYFQGALEVKDGVFIIGRKFNKGTSDLFVKKIDTNGKELWEKKYGEGNGRQDFFNSVYVVNDNEIVIGASTLPNQNIPWQQTKATVHIFAIDSLGVEKWSWESSQSLEEIRVTGLHQTVEGGWIYLTTRVEYETDGFFKQQPRLILRDSNFDLIKSLDLDDMDGQTNLPYNMDRLSDGGYLGVGINRELVENPGISSVHQYAWMVKVNEEGDTLWQRRYLTFPDTIPNFTIQLLHSAVELPSGSIICAGYFDGSSNHPKDWGILIKVDANGCVDTLGCGPISDLFQVDKPEYEVLVYPNPSEGDVTFSWPGSFSSTGMFIRLFDSNGKMIREIPVLPGAPSVLWHTNGLPQGLYFYQMISDEGLIWAGRVILMGL